MNEAKSNAEPKKSNAERQSCYRDGKLYKTLPLDVQQSIEQLRQHPGKCLSCVTKGAAREAVALGVKERYVSAS